MGSLTMLEYLAKAFQLSVSRELAHVPDQTPSFFKDWRERSLVGGTGTAIDGGGTGGGNCVGGHPTWAWLRLSPIEVAVLYRRVDCLVLLVRLGADMLHRTDHVAVRRPTHYSVSNYCFKNLTPLHLCALLDNRVLATVLLHEALDDREAQHL